MRSCSLVLTAIVVVLVLSPPASATVKRVPYPEVKVEVLESYRPDAAFEAMRKAFADAVVKKDAQALFALVGPTFAWTFQGALADEFDLGRDALHNFKVVFGFRSAGAAADGAVANGPFWDALAASAADATLYKANDAGNLVGGPIGANVADEKVFDQARKKVEPADDPADWYFTLAPTAIAKAPGDSGAPVAKVGTVAVPVLSTFPPPQEGKPGPAPAHIEVLLPSGKTGWIAAATARPLVSERLCYAKTPSGDWKIAAYDQAE